MIRRKINIFLLISILKLSHSAPCCRDQQPHFLVNENLRFCHQYSNVGCGTEKDDKLLKSTFDYTRRLIPRREKGLWKRCNGYVKEFLCERCSPNSLHVFGGGIKHLGEKPSLREFPGLCQEYCTDFFTKCGPIVKYYLKAINASNTQEV